MTLKGKIKYIIDFIEEHYFGFIFSEIFTTIICVSYFVQSKSHENYAIFAYFFLLVLILRTVTFIWNQVTRHKLKDNPYKRYRINFILLLIVSATLLFLNEGLNSVLMALSVERNNPDAMPLWWLILIILPFTSYSFVNSIMSYHKAKLEDDAGLMAEANLEFITSMYTFFGASIYLIVKFNENVAVVLWYILITIVIVLQVYVSIKSIVIGIQGISGKRKKKDDFIKAIEVEKEAEAIEEEKLLNEIEITE